MSQQQIVPEMEASGADGVHVGIHDAIIDGELIKQRAVVLGRSQGHNHFIDFGLVAVVEKRQNWPRISAYSQGPARRHRIGTRLQ